MSIGFVNKTSTVNSTSVTTCVISTPAGIAVGDILIAVVSAVGTSSAVTGPAGWTKLAEFNPTTSFKSALYYRNVTGTEAGSYSWTWSVSGRNVGQIVAYSGADLTSPPVYAVGAGTDDSVGPHSAPAVSVVNGGWLITAAHGRQSPGTAGALTWTIDDSSDNERYDQTATNTGTGAQLPTAFYDSNRALIAGGGATSGAAPPVAKYNALFSARGSMRVGITVKKENGELDYWRTKLTGLSWMRIFPNDAGGGIRMPPPWTDERFAFCQEFGAEPFISTKIDGNVTYLNQLMDYLEDMPTAAPWITRLWLTDRHEPEGDDVTPAQYIANIKALITKVNGLSPTLRAKIYVGPVLTRQYTENTAGRTYKTYDPGVGDFFGVDAYMNSWGSPSTAVATSFPNAVTFLSKIKAYRYSSSDTRLRILPELGGIGIPADTDGTLRAAWMQALQDEMASWTQAAQGWPFGGWLWWGTEGSSGSSLTGAGTRRWFTLDRRHNGQPYTYYDSAKKKTVTDPEGNFDIIPSTGGGGGGSGSASLSRKVTVSALVGKTHLWSVALAPASAPSTGAFWSNLSGGSSCPF